MSKKSKRRKLSRFELFPKKWAKENREAYIINYLISNAIPDPEKKEKYITALIKGLETEPTFEPGQYRS